MDWASASQIARNSGTRTTSPKVAGFVFRWCIPRLSPPRRNLIRWPRPGVRDGLRCVVVVQTTDLRGCLEQCIVMAVRDQVSDATDPVTGLATLATLRSLDTAPVR